MALPKIDVPIYETKLISTGKTIRFRPFLVKEQKLFLMASQSEDVEESVKVIKQVLNNCILDEIDVDSLPTYDLENLFIHLRARSVGEVVNLQYNCNNDVVDAEGNTKKCNNLVKIDVNLLEIKPTIDEKHTNKIEISSTVGIMMIPPTFHMLQKMNDGAEMDQILDIIVNCIEYIYDADNIYYAKDTDKTELVEFVENLGQKELEKIKDFFATLPKIEKNLPFHCKKCGYEETIKLQGINNFFG